MKYIIFLLVILIKMSLAMVTGKTDNTIAGTVGQMPEVVVTAERYEDEDKVWVGMLDTVVVTAPRVKVFTGRTEDKSSTNHNLLFPGLIFLGALSLSSLSWFVYRHYLPRRRRLQDCPC
ncbi:MAG: hypothetical protein JSW02_06400 [candidate division WOR-3 bacterium]|nr:MAG: hypothetical protein JSW02_06400 [candidate division WOR-3 bacterium]